MLCTQCMTDLPTTGFHHDRLNPTFLKFHGKVPISWGSSYLKFVKSGITQNLMKQLKYNNRPDVGEALGKWYGAELKSAGLEKEFDLLIPVPLHISKLRQRGYNQSDHIVKGLGGALGMDFHLHILKRAKKTSTQTKKSRVERWVNVDGVFQVIDESLLLNKNVLIVDDVVTTGATLEACCHSVLESGAEKVGVLTLATA